MIKVLLVGDRSESVLAHAAIPKALKLAASNVGAAAEATWLATDAIKSAADVAAQTAQAIWCVPGSPYASMAGALIAIRFARENKTPFLGTCGGFQHALIEYARNVLRIEGAGHEESHPAAPTLIVSRLQCAMVNRSERVAFAAGSRLREIYASSEAMEAYQCSYGVNPDMLRTLQDATLAFTAFNDHGEVRALELKGHPFFMGTLFQPERSAAHRAAHPLVSAFIAAAQAGSRS